MLRTYYKSFLKFKKRWSCPIFHRTYYYVCGPLEVEDGVILAGNDCWSCSKCGRSWAKISPSSVPKPKDTVIIGEFVSDGTFTNKENEDA